MTTTILIIINVFACIAIIALTLMQQSKGDMGSAFGGGSSQSMFGSRGSANFLSRSTSIMCVIFFASSLALAYVYAQRAESSSVIGSEPVIDQTIDVNDIVPSQDGVPTIPGIDVVPDTSVESDLPSIPDAASGAVEAIQETSDEVIDAIEEAAEEVPAVPQ